MSQGLQIFNENGICTLDVTDRLTRVLGEFETGTSSGSLMDNNLLTGTPWSVVSSLSDAGVLSFQSWSISFSGNYLYWNTIGYNPRNSKVIYGVY